MYSVLYLGRPVGIKRTLRAAKDCAAGFSHSVSILALANGGYARASYRRNSEGKWRRFALGQGFAADTESLRLANLYDDTSS